MPDDAQSSVQTSGLQEVIITLPRWVIALLGMLLVLGVLGSTWLALSSSASGVQEVAKSALLILLPLLVMVVAAIGIRRTSTTQVDQLVTAFLERTMLHRFELACTQRETSSYPFDAVRLANGTGGRSYARFDLRWAQGSMKGTWATVAVKMNVMNFEVIAEPLLVYQCEPRVHHTLRIDAQNLGDMLKQPLVSAIPHAVQGSVDEGYKVTVVVGPVGTQQVRAKLSFRLRLQNHFLASPFLKRYYSEDAAILLGVLHQELQDSKLLAGAESD